MNATRRRLLRQSIATLGLAAASPWLAAQPQAAPHTRIAAAWTSKRSVHGPRVGVLALDGATARVIAAIDLPGRAHGLLPQADGTLLVVARRPGDWLLRWHPGTGHAQWAQVEDDRAFTGHVLASADGSTLYTPETDLDSGQGLIGVRDARSLAKRAEWPTGGTDPHALVWDAGDTAGRLLVANGGIETRPESGRRKLAPQRMDPSLVAIDTRGGELVGQWRLDDRRLSLRHLAWGRSTDGQPMLGIAMQAEHDEPQTQAEAPVLARFDGRSLALAAPGLASPGGDTLAGYGGDIVGLAGGFAVSCPRAGGVARWQADGRWAGFIPLREACALAAGHGGETWMAGADSAQRWVDAEASASASETRPTAFGDLRLDNHWRVLG